MIKSRSPLAINLVRTQRGAVRALLLPVDLFGKPVKASSLFLRTCALTFVRDVSPQLTRADAHRAAQQFVHNMRWNDAREYGIRFDS